MGWLKSDMLFLADLVQCNVAAEEVATCGSNLRLQLQTAFAQTLFTVTVTVTITI